MSGQTTGKVAIITGANTGIGYETALGLAKQGYKVILACRSEEKANKAIQKIKRKVSAANTEFIKLDLVDRESIRAFAQTFGQRHNQLDALINNAGVMCPPYTVTQNNLELQLDANHIGHFYLTSLLMDQLDQAYETRIVNVSSLAGKGKGVTIHFDNINFEGTYEDGPEFFGLKGMVAYSQSKLANILFTMELKDRIAAAGKNIKAIVVHPGVSSTDLSRNMSWYMQFLIPIIGPFMDVSKPTEGAKPSLMAAVDPAVQAGDFIGPTGKKERVGTPGKVKLPENASDKEMCVKLWEFSENELGIQFEI